MHATALFSRKFPDGDRGGNLAYVVLHDGAGKTKLHPMWDGLLGRGTTASTVGRVVKQVKDLDAEDREAIQKDLEQHTTVESWARESFEAAKQYAYLGGKLPLADEDDDVADIDVAPEDYARKAGHVARVQIAKAGARLKTLLGDVLK